jgi:hypothetical protein
VKNEVQPLNRLHYALAKPSPYIRLRRCMIEAIHRAIEGLHTTIYSNKMMTYLVISFSSPTAVVNMSGRDTTLKIAGVSWCFGHVKVKKREVVNDLGVHATNHRCHAFKTVAAEPTTPLLTKK